MVVDRARIERLERELEEARRELLKEDGERYRILMRDIATEEKERILEALTNKEERILFGLEAPEERRRGAVIRPGGSRWRFNVLILRKDRAYQKRFGAACCKTAQTGN